MKVFCPDCGSHAALTAKHWRCDCGGAWEPMETVVSDPDHIDISDSSLWRYLRLYDLDFREPLFRLGAGWTPLLPAAVEGTAVLLKLEYLSPTGSFKDRGTEVMINILAHQGATHVVDDSSGNAGSSVAAYAARAGMDAHIFVPAYASPSKRAQIEAYGADIKPVPGSRTDTKLAALQAVESGLTAAFHAYHPGFLLGQESVGWEVWEQLGREAPEWYIVPVGQGVHLLGVWLAFCRLQAAGWIERVPRLVAVQAAACAPLCQAFKEGMDTVMEVHPTRTSVAEGLAITSPVRGKRLLQALRESDGLCIQVDEEAILNAQYRLAHMGFYAEPTSATAIAALPAVKEYAHPGDRIVVPLTGSGLKGAPKV